MWGDRSDTHVREPNSVEDTEVRGEGTEGGQRRCPVRDQRGCPAMINEVVLQHQRRVSLQAETILPQHRNVTALLRLCTTNVAFLRRPRRFLGNTGTSLRFSDSVASPLASAFSAPGGGRDEAPHTLWLRPSSCDVASPLTSAFSAACGCRDESPHTLWSRPWPASERQIR